MPAVEDKPTPADEDQEQQMTGEESVPAEGSEADAIPLDEGEEPDSAFEEKQPAALPPPAEKSMPASQEQTWAMISHLSILLNLVTGILGPVVALIIYLVYKDRSRYVAYQSLQALIFQLIVWIGIGLVIGAIWLFTGLLSIILIGLLLVPVALLATIFLMAVPLGSLIYGVYAGIKCSHGEDFRYWLVGDWVRSTYVQG